METETYYPTKLADWQSWLEKNHRTKASVWLIFYNKKSDKETLSWREAVDVALCFGWIDSKRQTIDEFSFRQFFSKRKPNSTWSKVNKDKIRQLMDRGLMKTAGYESVETAKQNGSWTILDDVEKLKIPSDLNAAFKVHKGSKEYFVGLSRSVKKMMLYWIVSAKRAETRQKRIAEIAQLAGRGQKPTPF